MFFQTSPPFIFYMLKSVCKQSRHSSLRVYGHNVTLLNVFDRKEMHKFFEHFGDNLNTQQSIYSKYLALNL